MKTNINTIIYYINLIFNSTFANEGTMKLKNHNASTFFTTGACWYYAYILKNIFPDGDIYLGNTSVGHVIFKYENKYYDVNGIYNPQDINNFYIDKEVIGSPSYFKTNHDEILRMCDFLINDVQNKFIKDVKRR